jgi:hypothetical protein
MQRAAARRVGQLPSTVASDSEGDVSPSPGRVAASNVPLNLSDRKSMPLSPAQFDPMINLPETPTKPFHRRVQSVFMPSSPFQKSPSSAVNGHLNDHSEGSLDGSGQNFTNIPQPGVRKGGRWNALIRFLRRGEQSTK